MRFLQTFLQKTDKRQLTLISWLGFIACYFFVSQPLDRASTTNAAVLLWVTGLIGLPFYLKEHVLTKYEKWMIAGSFLAFSITALSWLTSPYFDGSAGDLEIDLRFLLFPLAYFATKSGYFPLSSLTFSLFVGALAYGWVVWQWPSGRVAGDENAVTFGNGAFLLMVPSLLLTYLNKNWICRILALIAGSIFAYSSYESGTRGSFLAIPAVILILLFALPAKPKKLFISLALIASALLAFSPVGQKYKTGVNNIEAYFERNHIQSSIGQRIELWRGALCIFAEAPFLGSGPHQFPQAVQDVTKECNIVLLNPKGYFEQAHSYYFNSLATIGVLGLASQLTFLLLLIPLAFNLSRSNGLLVVASVTTMLSYGLTVDLFFHRYLIDKHLILLAILLGVAVSGHCTKAAPTPNQLFPVWLKPKPESNCVKK